MFERPATGERALLVHVDIGTAGDPEAHAEFRLLAEAVGAEVTSCLGGFRRMPDPRLFIGSGETDELKALIEIHGVELVTFDHGLSPAQERNLGHHLRCRVVDRTGLVLDIFAQRARSFEGKSQVELAQLRHLSTRLVRGWTHLERQKGSIGLRGTGRDPAGVGSPADRQTHLPAHQAVRAYRLPAYPGPPGAGSGRPGDGLTGWLHQRRKIDPLQPAAPVRCL